MSLSATSIAAADLQLIAIDREGRLDADGSIPPAAANVLSSMAALYQARGFQPPWIGYLARWNGEWVGTCAFTSSPVEGQIEIAYYCFAEYEGRGIATAMARSLVDLARREDARLAIYAYTLPEENASTAILRKLGFSFGAEVIHPEDGRVWRWNLA